ncbi:MAG: cadherin-like beta sandwich domain-containing protein, partial [Hungatella sp.]
SKISVSTQEVYDGNSQIVTIEKEGESAVTITGRSNASKESALSDLKISPGTLTPAFSPEVEAYTATVGADTTKIVVSATSTDEKAQVAISGNEELQMGDNAVVCKVIAEDGATVKNYTIQVTKGEGAVSDTTTAAAENGVKVETLAQTVTIIPLDDGVAIPEGFAECSIRIDDQEVIGWVWASEKDPKYCVFYGVTEAGEKDFYRYDLTQKTMQRYFQDPTSAAGVSMEQYTSVAEEYNSLLHDYKIRLYMIFALFALAVILLFALVILWLRKRQVENEDYGDSYKDEKPKEELQLRKKPVHRISKEEEYLRGLEAEEEAAKTRPEKSGQAEKTEQLKKTDSSEKTEETDDDDFEFIDLGL